MAKTYEYNPTSGCYTSIEDTADGGVVLKTIQDVQPVLDHVQRKRDSGLVDRGIKKDWWHYATIPAAVWLKWKQERGVDIFNKDHEKKVLKLINSEYPRLKNTYLKHG